MEAKPRDVLIKLIAVWGGEYETMASIRVEAIDLNGGELSGTYTDSNQAWCDLASKGGLRSARVSGRGVCKHKYCYDMMHEIFSAGEVTYWAILVPDFGSLIGQFKLTEVSPLQGDVFSLEMESVGAVEFSEANNV